MGWHVDENRRRAELQGLNERSLASKTPNRTTGELAQQRGSTNTEHLAAGQTIQDRYKVISLLGEGGMGSVYKVQHLYLQREYAVRSGLAAISNGSEGGQSPRSSRTDQSA